VQSDEYAGVASRKGIDILARIVQRLPGDLEEQTLLRIHARGLSRRDAEERRIEQVVDAIYRRAFHPGVIDIDPAAIPRGRTQAG
jgi:hypothetical protein